MNSKFFLSLLAPAMMMAGPYAIDIDATVDPVEYKANSYIDMTYQHNFDFEGNTLIVSPKFTGYFGGNHDFSFATTVRYKLTQGSFGVGAFWDNNNVGLVNLKQTGLGVDYLTDKYEVRANYYHPLDSFGIGKKGILWTTAADVEYVHKFKLAHVGVKGKYNFDYDDLHAYGKVFFPALRLTVNCGLTNLYTSDNLKQGFDFSLTYNLFGSERMEGFVKGIEHNSRI